MLEEPITNVVEIGSPNRIFQPVKGQCGDADCWGFRYNINVSVDERIKIERWTSKHIGNQLCLWKTIWLFDESDFTLFSLKWG